MQTGLEVLQAGGSDVLNGRKFGLLLNEASVDRRMRLACDMLAHRHPGQMVAMFAPQHGLWGRQQANMIESTHATHPQLRLPIYSLYSDVRAPTDEMLDGIDCLVIDLQDVGCRVYTFIWTITNCLRACARRGIEVLVLDRPNPIGSAVHGPAVMPDYFSFVGLAEVPLQHGLTIGELTCVVNRMLGLNASIGVVPVQDWQRETCWPATERAWVQTSPNLPSIESLQLYPGMVLLEGTNISEGRGTTAPFTTIGAPWIDGWELCEHLCNHDGITLRPTYFKPTFDKYTGESCGGIAVHPTGGPIDSVTFAIDIILTCAAMYPRQFRWNAPPYEYETKLAPIDILYGSDRLRRAVSDCLPSELASELTKADVDTWRRQCDGLLLYGPI
jgi:uncharacterized protein YbbC (DUF1343 family)